MPSARPGAAESIARSLRTGSPVRVLVRTVTGLERVAAEELTAAGHRVIDLSTRQLVVEPVSDSIVTSPPRVADDLFVVGADVVDPGRTKADLGSLAPVLRDRLAVPLPQASGEAISVSASFLGRRTYSRFDIEDLVGMVVAERTGARYHSRRNGEKPPPRRADWRVVLDGRRARVAMRPFDAPLHRRDWRTRTVVGSLHPPVAAALARLARIEAGHRVLDPCCGAGTMLLEAWQLQPAASYTGIDRDPDAIVAARANTPSGAPITWARGDARALDPVGTEADRIVTNPPWNVRLEAVEVGAYADQWRRVLRPGGLLVVIANRDQAQLLVEHPGWRVNELHELSVAGQHPCVVVATPT